jgi:hypothetical protein
MGPKNSQNRFQSINSESRALFCSLLNRARNAESFHPARFCAVFRHRAPRVPYCPLCSVGRLRRADRGENGVVPARGCPNAWYTYPRRVRFNFGQPLRHRPRSAMAVQSCEEARTLKAGLSRAALCPARLRRLLQSFSLFVLGGAGECTQGGTQNFSLGREPVRLSVSVRAAAFYPKMIGTFTDRLFQILHHQLSWPGPRGSLARRG